MKKINVFEIIWDNYQEAAKLLWDNKQDQEVELLEPVNVSMTASDGVVTKVRATKLNDDYYSIEVYFEDVDEVDSGWTDDSDLTWGTQNDVYLAIGKLFEVK